MISGLLKPDAGEILVDGHAFWADPQRAKKIMGVVPQEVAVYEELTGRENLEFWGRIAGLGKAEARRAPMSCWKRCCSPTAPATR